MRSPNVYLERMKKTINVKEKLFFLKYIDVCSYDIIVDFGCADGSLLNVLDLIIPKESSTIFCGIDNQFEPKILRPRGFYCKSLQKLGKCIPLDEFVKEGKRILIIFSSVLHELGYKSSEDVLYEISTWCQKYATTVVCRDMYFLEEKLTASGMLFADEKKEWAQLHNLYKESDSSDYTSSFVPNYREKLAAIRDNYKINHQLSLSATALLYEFFLKYTYDENWDTEVQEMYFCNNAHELLSRLIRRFKVAYNRVYTLPYKKKEVKKRFGYKMKLPTHIQYILEREE